MLKEKIGFVLVAIALTMANGANEPWIPMAVMATGLWLMRGMIGDDKGTEDI